MRPSSTIYAKRGVREAIKAKGDSRTLGKKGEDQACAFLKDRGYCIIERNFRCPFGELDIVALEAKELVFVEVKTRSSSIFGTPEEAISRQKLQTIERVGNWYQAKKKNLPEKSRIDVVAIDLSSSKIDLLENVTG